MKYSAVHGLRPVEKLEEPADGSIGSDELAKGGRLFAWNFSVIRSTLLKREGLEYT